MNENAKEQVKEIENADIICDRIRREAQEEVSSILGRASQEAERIVREASENAKKKLQERKLALDAELEKERERSLSGINLERKRLSLEEKNTFVGQVLAEVAALAGRFREKEEYASFMEKAIAQGVSVVDEKSVTVEFSPQDQALTAHPGFRERVLSLARTSAGTPVSISWVRGDFADPGVIVASPDGRIRFDNRFSARLGRMRERIVTELLREAW